MTNAEVKVKEVADAIREKIARWKNEGASREVILERVDAYLSGLSDGIDFCDTMRSCEQRAVDSAIAKVEEHEAKMNSCFPQSPA